VVADRAIDTVDENLASSKTGQADCYNAKESRARCSGQKTVVVDLSRARPPVYHDPAVLDETDEKPRADAASVHGY
jgi:hypothetical protein